MITILQEKKRKYNDKKHNNNTTPKELYQREKIGNNHQDNLGPIQYSVFFHNVYC